MNKFIALFLAAAIGFTFQTTTIFSAEACDDDNPVQKGKNKNKSRESGQDELNLHGTLFHSTSDKGAVAPEDSAPLRVKTSRELEQDNN